MKLVKKLQKLTVLATMFIPINRTEHKVFEKIIEEIEVNGLMNNLNLKINNDVNLRNWYNHL